MKKSKIVILIGFLVIGLFTLTGCSEYTTSSTKEDISSTLNVGNKLTEN